MKPSPTPSSEHALEVSSRSLILSHESALEFHRARRVAAALGRPYPSLDEMPRSNNGGISLKDLSIALGLPSTLHVSVQEEQPRIKSPYIHCHALHGTMPSIPICPGLSVATPEEALFQICARSGFVRQSLLAYEACGSFAICQDAEDGFINDLEPLTTPQVIRDYIDGKAGNRRSARFRTLQRIMSSLVAGAASPAEAKLCLAIVAPRTLGGQGLPKPKLNAEIRVEGTASSLTQRSVIRPDELWEELKLILEYMGSRHAEVRRMGEDASRDNTLGAMGYKVIHVTKRQVQDPRLYCGLMEHLRSELGVTKEIPSQRILERQETLRALLFDPSKGSLQ